MTYEHWYFLGNYTLLFAAVVSTVLVIIYGAFSKFEETQVGRQFFITKFILAVILDFWAITTFGTQAPPRPEFASAYIPRTIIYFAVGIIMLRWLIIVLKTQRDVRRREAQGENP